MSFLKRQAEELRVSSSVPGFKNPTNVPSKGNSSPGLEFKQSF